MVRRGRRERFDGRADPDGTSPHGRTRRLMSKTKRHSRQRYVPALIGVAIASAVVGAASADATDPTFRAASGPPRAGSLFAGVTVTFHDHAAAHYVTCDARIGGHIVKPPGSVAFAGGTWLRPTLLQHFVQARVGGQPYLVSETCGWKIPATAAGKLLSILPPPDAVPCDTSCLPSGVTVDSATTFNQTTWRVAPPRRK